MKATELAFELAQLDADDRAELLAELPDDRRSELTALIVQVEPLLSQRTPSFDAELARLETDQPAPDPLSALSESQLRALLAAELFAVQVRLITAVRTAKLDLYPPAVRRVITAHLTRRGAFGVMQPSRVSDHTKRWWRSLWRLKA